MLYDSISYISQIEAIARSHKESGDKPENSGEFLSGFYKSDRLIPVITLTIYFGADEWDAPTTLYELFGEYDKRLERFIQNYKLNLVAPAEMDDDDFTKLSTDLSEVLKFIKYSKDKEQLNKVFIPMKNIII